MGLVDAVRLIPCPGASRDKSCVMIVETNRGGRYRATTLASKSWGGGCVLRLSVVRYPCSESYAWLRRTSSPSDELWDMACLHVGGSIFMGWLASSLLVVDGMYRGSEGMGAVDAEIWFLRRCPKRE
jgi:hypothetical protein